MNKRIKELMNQAMEDSFMDGLGGPRMELNPEKLAELIVKECIYTLQLKIVRNGNTPENIRTSEHINDLGNKFGISFPMDYPKFQKLPKCSICGTTENVEYIGGHQPYLCGSDDCIPF